MSRMVLPKERWYGTGRRKTAIARVWLVNGKGGVRVNHQEVSEFALGRQLLVQHIREPLEVTKTADRFDVRALCLGGGVTGQSGAVRLGIARALIVFDPALRPVLRRGGFLTRDPRAKERKKYGRKRARRGFQFTKR